MIAASAWSTIVGTQRSSRRRARAGSTEPRRRRWSSPSDTSIDWSPTTNLSTFSGCDHRNLVTGIENTSWTSCGSATMAMRSTPRPSPTTGRPAAAISSSTGVGSRRMRRITPIWLRPGGGGGAVVNDALIDRSARPTT